MAEFSKAIDMRIIEKLRGEPLFTERLFEDIITGRVFPSIRDGYVKFHYGGTFMFRYDGAFATICQVGFVPQADDEFIDVDETLLAGMKPQARFVDAYEQIRYRCMWSSGLRGGDVPALYKFSFAAYHCEWYFVLDMGDLLGGHLYYYNSHDLLLMDAHTGRLLFCRAVSYSDMQLALAEEVKNIADQLEEYRNLIAKHRDEIISWYGQYTRAMQALTGIGLPAPTGVCGDCGLLIYGFDEDQQNGKLKKITDSLTKMGWPVCAVRDISDVTPETLFTRLGGDAA